ncbi:hypothetical protein ES288_D06G082300v1 [Gossypium darwinii]|uniref:RING-type E3 ubiquitin transferase n=1 Tax=Gossypium darwinii TaxID=34276 RepID=A0A5D2C3D1_GOSDA|nr:hypothetical protein ES288_D06G082300v1 [Gossypium darwinii]
MLSNLSPKPFPNTNSKKLIAFAIFPMATSGSAKYHVVSHNTVPVPFDQQYFDLDDAMMMPENLQATLQTVIRLVSDMPTVHYPTGSCSICMESFWSSEGTSAAPRQVSCGHVYHHNCITVWLLNSNSYSCPLCRCQISR